MRSGSPARSPWTLAAPALALVACEPGPAFDFELVSDPNVATEAQIVAQVGSLVFVLDSAGGLYAPGSERTEGSIQIKDADADPDDLELVVTLPVDGPTLPTVRIERGGLPDVPVDVRVIGLSIAGNGPPVADGVLRGLRFGGEPEEITLPFNLRDEVLPPRVDDVIPADGSDVPGCVVPSILLVFSRPMDEATLTAPGAVRVEPSGMPAAVTLDEAGLVATISGAALAGDGASLTYRVTVDSSVRGREGHPLDQVAVEAGPQPYVADFHQTCSPPPLDPDMPCGAVICPASGRLDCVADQCVPVACTTDCTGATVCDPLRDHCVDDCRAGGAASMCLEGSSCDAASGLCL
jgi:Bacterial Ig-like domain